MAKYQKQASREEIKKALAAKCMRLADCTGSKPRRKSLLHHAQAFRQQAADLARQPKKG